MKRSKGFTLVELLVVVAIIALLVSILLPTLNRARELAKQALCSANLNGVGKGIVLYQAEANDSYPFAKLPAAVGDYSVAMNGGAADPYGLTANMLENLNMLVYKGQVSFSMFICPSSTQTGKAADRALGGNNKYGFKQNSSASANPKVYIDYAYQIGYPTKDGTTDNPAKLGSSLDGNVAIMADRPDTTSRVANFSPDHPLDGESVLFAGWNVRFAKESQNKSGWGSNCIYVTDMTATVANGVTTDTVTANPANASPGYAASKFDSVLYYGSTVDGAAVAP